MAGLGFIYDPLEQFDFLPFYVYSDFLMVDNFFICFVIVSFLIYVICRQLTSAVVSLNNVALIKKKIFNFIKTIVIENVSLTAQKHFPLIYYIFLFLFFCNFLGMVPYSFTVTSSFAVTLFLSLGFFIGVNVIGLIIRRESG